MFSQSEIKGSVMGLNSQGEQIPLLGVNVFWFNTSVGLITSEDGTFSLPYEPAYKKLVFSYVGYQTSSGIFNKH